MTTRSVPHFHRPTPGTLSWTRYGLFAASVVMIAGALHLWGAKEFRDDSGAIVLLTVIGAVWLAFATRLLFPCFGLSDRDDVVEQRNPAALAAFCGALPAAAIIYAGGNIGEGPEYSENVVSVTLGAVSWLILWATLEFGAKVSRSVTEEWDLASGLRLGSFLLASGLILGRAVAGNWHSEDATIHDLIRDGWPALILCAIALLVEKLTKPSRRRPFPPWPSHGLLPASVYLAMSIAWLWHLGPWEGFSR